MLIGPTVAAIDRPINSPFSNNVICIAFPLYSITTFFSCHHSHTIYNAARNDSKIFSLPYFAKRKSLIFLTALLISAFLNWGATLLSTHALKQADASPVTPVRHLCHVPGSGAHRLKQANSPFLASFPEYAGSLRYSGWPNG